MRKTTNRFSAEVRERAVRLVLDDQGRHGSRRQAVPSIPSKIGGALQTLNDGVSKAAVDSGKRAGVSSEMAGKSEPSCAIGPGTMASDFPPVAPWKGPRHGHADPWRSHGSIHVAFVIDAHARRIVGWRVSTTPRARFVLGCLRTGRP